MSKYGPFFLFFLFSSLFSNILQADAVELIGQTPVKVSTTGGSSKSVVASKTILLQNIKLSPNAKLALKGRINELQTNGNLVYRAAVTLPAAINLGMNKTPVLDQGAHGTCVTFAMTGAIDAVIGKGDYISQLCPLELANYLVGIKKAPYPYSGWDGTWGASVQNLLTTYGIVPKAYQLKYGCPQGITQYPMGNSANTKQKMTIAAYSTAATPVPSYVLMSLLLDINTSFSPNYNPTTTLTKVKQALKAGQRVTIGFLLDESQGSAGAVGTKTKKYDSWVMNATILKKAKAGAIHSGHEIIIIGYDDNATARGSDGVTSKGLLILMNSWGAAAGNNGVYYMSYDYFKYLADEAIIVGHK